MLLLDDILLFPVRGICWVFREVHNAAQKELANEAETITAELRELHMTLEKGQITEAAFAARERQLLDRLDRIEERETFIRGEDTPTEEQHDTQATHTRQKETVRA